MRVLGTGVTLRLARVDGDPPTADEVYVVAQAFVEYTEGPEVRRWDSYEHHGHVVPLDRDATLELVALADNAAGDLIEDLLSDMRIAGLGVSRWEFVSAARRIELAPDLEARLAPLRRG